MELLEGIRGRRSIREYTDQDVPLNIIEEIIADAAYAPSWKNSQTTSYIAIKNKAILEQIKNEGLMGFAPNQKRVNDCNTLVVVLTQKGISGYNPDYSAVTSLGTHWQSFDAGIAVQTLCLSAHAHNVGSLIMGIYDETAIAKILNIDLSTYQISCLVALSYYEKHPNAPKRKEISELLTVIN